MCFNHYNGDFASHHFCMLTWSVWTDWLKTDLKTDWRSVSSLNLGRTVTRSLIQTASDGGKEKIVFDSFFQEIISGKWKKMTLIPTLVFLHFNFFHFNMNDGECCLNPAEGLQEDELFVDRTHLHQIFWCEDQSGKAFCRLMWKGWFIHFHCEFNKVLIINTKKLLECATIKLLMRWNGLQQFYFLFYIIYYCIYNLSPSIVCTGITWHCWCLHLHIPYSTFFSQ